MENEGKEETGDNEQKVNKGLKSIAKSSMIVFFGVFLSKLITYIYRIVIARHFGPEVYGLYSLAAIILGLFVVISSFGLIEGLVRFTSLYRGKKQTNKIKYLLKFITGILFFSSIFFGIILFLSANFISTNIFHNQSLAIFLKIFSILVPLTNLTYVFLHIIRAFEKIGFYSFVWNVLQNFVKLTTLILFIFIGLKTNAVIFSYFLGIVSMLLASYFFCKYKLSEVFTHHGLNKKEKSKIFKEVSSYSWPVMFSGLIATIFYWIDSSLLGYFMGAINVGIYNAATPLVGLMAFIPAMFAQLFFPLITKEFSRKNHKVIRELSKQVGKWIFILNLPLFLIMFAFPNTLVNTFFGEQYLIAGSVLRILSVGGLISSLSFLSTDLITMIGKSKLILMNIIGASILNVILNAILIPRYGLNGAAIATMIVTALFAITLLCEVKHHIKVIPIKRTAIKISIASLIPISVLMLVKRYLEMNPIILIFLGIFFILSYTLLLLITRSLDKNDLFLLKNLKEKIFKNKE